MACSTKSTTSRLPVQSDGTTTDRFFPFVQMQVARAERARISVVLEGSTQGLTITAAARYANTEQELPSAIPVAFPNDETPTVLTDDGQAFGSAYRNLDEAKQLVEFGVNVKNSAGTALEKGLVTIVVDILM